MLRSKKLQKGDLVKRVIASHYTDHIRSDAFGVVLTVAYPIARVYFYDTNQEELWNQNVLELISSKPEGEDNENRRSG